MVPHQEKMTRQRGENGTKSHGLLAVTESWPLSVALRLSISAEENKTQERWQNTRVMERNQNQLISCDTIIILPSAFDSVMAIMTAL